MSATAYLSRVLQMLCQPLQGAYSTGTALVSSASAPVTLQPGDVLVPIIDDCETEAAAVKVDPNPATTDHSWPIVTTGTAVGISSLQGGAHVNLPAGTQLRFDDAPAGIVELAAVSTAMIGGTRLETFGALRQVVAYKDLGSQPDAKSFFSAQLGEYPAAALTWVATTPGDGSASPSMGVDQTRLGRASRFYCHEWNLFIISTRCESTNRRKREGDTIRDRMLQVLCDRQSWRSVQLSSSVHPIKILDARLAKAGSDAYIDVIRFATWFVLERTDARVFNPWVTTNLREDRPSTTQAGVTTDQTIVDIDIPMPQSGD